jgi:Ca2+-transporting ATPase
MVETKNITGLNSQEAWQRLAKFGPNEIERKRRISWLRLIFDQIASPFIYILIFAGIISFLLGDYIDSVVILTAVLVNTCLGFFQEFKAEKSLFALQQLIIPHSWVVRDGKEQYLESHQLVPQDLVVLKTGDKVPADGVIIEGVELFVNEAILTGESEPLRKKMQSEVFMGTVVVAGRGKMLVARTGMGTKMGQIAATLQKTETEETPLQRQIKNFSHKLVFFIVIISLFVFFNGFLKGQNFEQIFTLSVAVAVSAVPEGLAISMTTILALGMQQLLKTKVLVRKLLAAETLGNVSCLCVDKTGTLTEGKMRVVNFETDSRPIFLQSILLCNNLINPLELAMFEWAKKQLEPEDGMVAKILAKKRIDEVPFSSQRKYLAALYQDYFFISGAPEIILSFCQMDQEGRKTWERKLSGYTHKGWRVVAFAYHKREDQQRKINPVSISHQLHWLGFLVFEDPPRKDAAAVLKVCQRSGIKIKVITGDHKDTALAILRQLDIGDGGLGDEQILEGDELEKIADEELVKIIDRVVLFCRTTPQHKIKIVQALQARGEVVAMMGDGVNDALALKRADIGVVVGEASAVAKETADMVLLDSNLNTIVQAVALGRAIFANIRKVILYLLSDSFTELVLVSGAILVGLPAPILASQILWVNLIEDGLPGIVLAFEPQEKGLLDRPPRKKDDPILDRKLKMMILIIASITNLGLLGIFVILCKTNVDINLIRTIIFVELGIDSLFYLFSCKSLEKNIWQTAVFNNPWLNLSVILGLFLLFGAVYIPFLQIFLKTVAVPLWAFILLIFLAVIKIVIIEVMKILFRKEYTHVS